MQNVHSASVAYSRPDQTAALTRGVTRLMLDLAISPLHEFRLANGRRADIAGLDRGGRLTLIEVKSCRADFECDNKWRDYLEFCDKFFFAVGADFPMELLPDDCGLMIADAFGASIHRPCAERAMAPARRKAVTLRFARQSASRLTASGLSSLA